MSVDAFRFYFREVTEAASAGQEVWRCWSMTATLREWGCIRFERVNKGQTLFAATKWLGKDAQSLE